MAATRWSPLPNRLRLHPDTVDVVRIRLDAARDRHALASLLSPEERARRDALHREADRRRFEMAHGALRAVLAAAGAGEPASVVLANAPGGKPRLASGALRFGLSHSGELALVALAASREVGIDVERHREDVPWRDIAGRHFAPAELDALTALPPPSARAAFFDAWTRKEALLKASGHGLSRPLASVPVEIPAAPAAVRVPGDGADTADGWTLAGIDVGAGYSAALAVKGGAFTLRLWDRS